MASLLKVGPLGSVRHPPYTNGLSSKDASAAEDLSCLANQSARHVFLPSYFNQPPKADDVLACVQGPYLSATQAYARNRTTGTYNILSCAPVNTELCGGHSSVLINFESTV